MKDLKAFIKPFEAPQKLQVCLGMCSLLVDTKH